AVPPVADAGDEEDCEEVFLVAMDVAEEDLDCVAEEVAGDGAGGGPEERAGEVEDLEAQGRDAAAHADREGQDDAQAVEEAHGEDDEGAVAVEELVGARRGSGVLRIASEEARPPGAPEEVP